jgi:hypothetical protein
MKKVALALVLGAALGSSTAHAIVFTSTSFTTVANASVGNVLPPSGDFDTSPPSPLVLNSTAKINTGTDSSFANATGDTLFLVANSEAKSSVESAHADGSADFNGQFMFPIGSCQAVGCVDKLPLSIGFDAQAKVTGSGTAETKLTVTMFGDGAPLFDQDFTNPGTLNLSIDVPFGTQLGNLDLTLTSTSDATIGTAFGLASASFNVTVVPEPAIWGFLASGILLLLYRHRRVRAA